MAFFIILRRYIGKCDLPNHSSLEARNGLVSKTRKRGLDHCFLTRRTEQKENILTKSLYGINMSLFSCGKSSVKRRKEVLLLVCFVYIQSAGICFPLVLFDKTKVNYHQGLVSLKKGKKKKKKNFFFWGGGGGEFILSGMSLIRALRSTPGLSPPGLSSPMRMHDEPKECLSTPSLKCP